jgi:hypothetical protein
MDWWWLAIIVLVAVALIAVALVSVMRRRRAGHVLIAPGGTGSRDRRQR